jgi:hypothetical protein
MPKKQSELKEIASNDGTNGSTFDSKTLPTLLQWLKKKGANRDSNRLYPVRLVFFDGGFGNHTLCTEEFRARLSNHSASYDVLSEAVMGAERENCQLYIAVPAESKGTFKLVQTDSGDYQFTSTRWIGTEDPYIGVELIYAH